jgi:hypothetical protein
MPKSAVARAAYSPQVGLTGFLGGASTQLSSLFNGPAGTWSMVPQVTQPIFSAGRIKSGVRLAQADRDHYLVQYEKVIQTAFTEVSDALIAHQRMRESRKQQEGLVGALEDRVRLAYLRYRGGVDTPTRRPRCRSRSLQCAPHPRAASPAGDPLGSPTLQSAWWRLAMNLFAVGSRTGAVCGSWKLDLGPLVRHSYGRLPEGN